MFRSSSVVVGRAVTVPAPRSTAAWRLRVSFRLGEISVRLFVRNLPFTISKEDLRALFTPYGVVATVMILTDPTTGRSRGCGFVEMPNTWATLEAMRGLQGIVLEGCPLLVTLAMPQAHQHALLQPDG